jgi:hypothetical protein
MIKAGAVCQQSFAVDTSGGCGEVVRLKQGIQLLAQTYHLIGIAWEPGVHPIRALEKRHGSLASPADTDAAHQPGGVDKTHLVENVARGGKADGERAEGAYTRKGFGNTS